MRQQGRNGLQTKHELILASTSESRAALLRGAGIEFTQQHTNIDERAVACDDLGPRVVALKLAEAKAAALSASENTLVLGADQTLGFENQLLHKSEDLTQAKNKLIAMRGKPHMLYSAASLYKAGERVWSHVDIATMYMRNFSDEFLENYVEEMGPDILATVGGYKLEALGVQLFENVEGDWFTVLGLPLFAVLAELRKFGLVNA